MKTLTCKINHTLDTILCLLFQLSNRFSRCVPRGS